MKKNSLNYWCGVFSLLGRPCVTVLSRLYEQGNKREASSFSSGMAAGYPYLCSFDVLEFYSAVRYSAPVSTSLGDSARPIPCSGLLKLPILGRLVCLRKVILSEGGFRAGWRTKKWDRRGTSRQRLSRRFVRPTFWYLKADWWPKRRGRPG